MRVAGPFLSLGVHVIVIATVLLDTGNARSHPPVAPRLGPLVFPPADWETPEDALSGVVPTAPVDLQVPVVAGTVVPQTGALPSQIFAPAPFSRLSRDAGLPAPPFSRLITEQAPEILAGPLPRYPDLLRQAGVQGRVLLQAIVDTTGRVQPQSVVVVVATHPGFVAAARQALEATLFRPARVDGRPVRIQVRIPFEFTLRGGTGPAR